MEASQLDALVDAARAGGHWAFERLWLELSPRVAGYLRGRGVTDADDVTSEVFLAAFQRIEGFDGDGSAFRSWLFTIAHHKAVDAARRRSRAPDLQPYHPVRDLRTATSAEHEAVAAREIDEVKNLLATLSPDQAEVMLLRVLGDLSVAEVAQATGRSQGAVKQLQRRAVAQLQRRIEETQGYPVPSGPSTTIAPSR